MSLVGAGGHSSEDQPACFPIKCTTIREPVRIGIRMKKEEFEKSTMQNNAVFCGCCGKLHVFSKKDITLLPE